MSNLDPAKKNSIVLARKWSVSAVCGVALASFTCLTFSALAQAPAAPIPAQLSTAKTLFIANAGTIDNQYSTLAYNDLYQQLSAWPQHTLASSPENADLALEISLSVELGAVTNGSSVGTPYLRLIVRDPKSHTLLWSIVESVGGAFRQKTFEKNLNDASAKIALDLKTLASGTATESATAAAAKTRFSDQGKN